jgi:hypothetical protein
MTVRRRWSHNHSEGWDADFEDFTPTYGCSDSLEDTFLLMAVNGFACGYPECCVFDFLRKWCQFFQNHDLEVIRSKRHGLTETGQPYAQCEAHKSLI